MTAIHQFVPMLHRDDAVGRHTLRLRDVLVSRGIELAHLRRDDRPRDRGRDQTVPRYGDDAQRGDVLLYQFATASAIAPWLAARRETLAVNYHNVTPPEYYAAWNNPMARHQLRAAPAGRPGRPDQPRDRGVRVQRGRAAHRWLRAHRRGPAGRHCADRRRRCRRNEHPPSRRHRPALDLHRPGRPQQGHRARPHGAPRGAGAPRPRRHPPGRGAAGGARLHPRPRALRRRVGHPSAPSRSAGASATPTWCARWRSPTP